LAVVGGVGIVASRSHGRRGAPHNFGSGVFAKDRGDALGPPPLLTEQPPLRSARPSMPSNARASARMRVSCPSGRSFIRDSPIRRRCTPTLFPAILGFHLPF